jgi:hypothetical protein
VSAVPRAHHKQVRITHGDREADVDKAIAPLFLELWRADIGTWMSCQRHAATGRVWVAFESAVEVENFLRVVAPYDPESGSLYERAGSWYFGEFEPVSGISGTDLGMRAARAGKGADPDQMGAWQYHAAVQDLVDREGGNSEAPGFAVSISVLFPRSDYAVVLKRMRAFNAVATGTVGIVTIF